MSAATPMVQNPILNLFKIPPTDMSLMNRQEVEYQPFSSGITPLEFSLPPQDGMVDMSRSHVEVKCKFKQGDGTALPTLAAPATMFPVTNLGHSIVANVRVSLNGTLVSGQSDKYAYKAFLDTVVNHDREDGKTLLRASGWRNGLDPKESTLTANQLDITHNDFKALSATHQEALLGMRAEYAKIREKERTFIIRPFNELFCLSKVLIPGVSINIQITFNRPEFYMMTYRGTTTASLTAANVKAKLVLCHVTPVASLGRELTTKMMRNVTAYPT